MQVPAPFEYERATSVDHALSLLERLGPESHIIAGGHSLLPMMKLRLAAPEYLIDVNDLEDELGYVREEDGELRIGALTRHRELLEDELLREHFPIFADAEEVIADPVVRNRGTIGGALCQADPAEDLSAVCSAARAKAVIRGTGGERVVDMGDFHRGPYETALEGAEMLVELRLPLRDGGEGRAPARRLGRRSRRRGRVDGRRHDRRGRDRPGGRGVVGGPRATRCRSRHGQAAVGGAVR